MSYLLVFGFGIFSAYLFDLLPVMKNTALIFELQKISFRAMRDSTLTDEHKQKFLLINSGKILLVTLKLLCFFSIVLIPFALLVSLNKFLTTINIESLLTSLKGIALSSFAFVSYFLLKKLYGKLRI